MVTNVLEEVAATVSRTARLKDPRGRPMQSRDLRQLFVSRVLEAGESSPWVEHLQELGPTFGPTHMSDST